MNKRGFTIIENGTSYELPTYKVTDGIGIERLDTVQTLEFVRGSKAGTEDVAKREGTLHEHLLSCIIHDLKFKNKLVPSRESATCITNLEQALFWMEERQRSREAAGVVGTYKEVPKD